MATVVVAGGFVASALYVVAVSGWTVLFGDQWRIFADDLRLGFPGGLLVAQNGHHPVLPGVIFWIDFFHCGAHNELANSTGLAAAIAFCSVATFLLTRRSDAPWGLTIPGSGILWLAVFWLGNGRVLVHGNESLHVYPVLLFLVLAAWALAAGRPAGRGALRPPMAVAAALLCCLAATLTFSFGLITWLVVLATATALGYSRATIASLLVAVGMIAAAYLLLQTGTGGLLTRGILTPWRLLADAATWLGAPVARVARSCGLVGDGDIPLHIALASGAIGAVAGGGGWMLAARRGRLRRPGELAVGALVLFGPGCAVLVAAGRAPYFALLPEQRLALRYLPWSSVFWGALVVAFGAVLIGDRSRRRVGPRLWAAIALAVPLLLGPSQHGRYVTIWRASTMMAATGLVAGVHDDAIVRRRIATNLDDVYSVARYLERHRSGPFAWPIAGMIGRRLPAAGGAARRADGDAGARLGLLRDEQPPAARFSGLIRGPAFRRPPPFVVVLDPTDVVRGVGIVTGANGALGRRLGLLPPWRPRYTGYVRGYDPNVPYRVWGLSSSAELTSPLGRLARPESGSSLPGVGPPPRTPSHEPRS